MLLDLYWFGTILFCFMGRAMYIIFVLEFSVSPASLCSVCPPGYAGFLF